LTPAQQSSTPPTKSVAPTVLPDSAKAPDLSKPATIATDGCCWNNGCERPLRAWVDAEYLLWWTKGAPLSTPLVTTGSLTDIPPGALGQPGTRVLFGDHSIGFGALSGLRVG